MHTQQFLRFAQDHATARRRSTSLTKLRWSWATVFSVATMFSMPTLSRAGFVYDDFASTSGLVLRGSASKAISADGNVLRLTPPVPSRTGSAFTTSRQGIKAFESVFSFRITDNGGPLFGGNTASGADGIVFVIHNSGNSVGVLGQGIGYEGISSSLGIEFDTWLNPGNSDPSQSHVAFNFNGSVDHNGANGPTANVSFPDLDEGDRWWVWVTYHNGTLRTYLRRSESEMEPVRPGMPILTDTFNLSSLVGGNQAFVGFTSGTGSDYANHDILYWRYTPIPEASSLSLLCMASMGIAGYWYRRRGARKQ